MVTKVLLSLLALIGIVESADVCACTDGKEGCSSGYCVGGYKCVTGSVSSCERACYDSISCNSHGTADYTTGVGCSCSSCETGYDGASCNACAEAYLMKAGKCEPKCSIPESCSNRATDVKYKSGSGSCECTCTDQWGGASCNTCDSKFSATCNSCSEGRIDYPTCTLCTPAKHCNNHALTSTDATPTTCSCDCKSEYEGATCNACSAGRVEYPACTTCTNDEACNGHASKVLPSSDKLSCECTCSNKWEGNKCQTCPSMYEGTDCNKCSSSGIVYPTCTQCDPATHCSNHASSVSANTARTSCECVCSGKWEGTSCSSCPTKYEQSTCDKCATGYINYPACTECTDAECNGHSSGVTSNSKRTACECTCANEWTGATCGTCPSPYTGSSCNKCKDGYEKYPTCSAICTVADDCSGSTHASKVDWVSGTTCDCTCKNKWTGSTCNSCPTGYDSSNNCASCKDNYIGYPNCVACDTTAHCSGHASKATSTNHNTCTCTCTNKWSGGDCSKCNSPFSGSSCNKCADGYESYPTCSAICTNADDCSGHASKVKWVSGTTCDCTCKNKWTGNTCNSCPTGYDSSNNCASCKDDYIGYPNCVACDTTAHCSGHASKATSTNHNTCTCACTNKWSGGDCSKCNAPFGGSSCNQCAGGYVNYPTCSAICTNSGSCNSHASKVVWVSGTTCDCTCKNKWTGNTCNSCPTGYDSSNNCASCKDNYIGYPNCVACDTTAHCSGHASKATSTNHNTCTCACTNKWSGGDCSKCNAPFGGSSCNQCAGGYVNYPTCSAICTNSGNCNSHASKVVWVSGTTCDCTCKNKWTGSTCNSCPTGYDSSNNCASCKDNYIGYPNCVACDTTAHCSGHASKATSTNHNTCTCTCTNKWSGGDCSKCDAPFGGSSCNQCAGGYVNYPTCSPICTGAVHCNGRGTAVWVKGDGSQPGDCTCTCDSSMQWTGATCDSCLSKYNSGCNGCATGSINYPNCVACDPATHCNGHASGATSDSTNKNCICTCMNKFNGATCDNCPAPYQGAMCNECQGGFPNYPTCSDTCSIAVSCQNRASKVVWNGSTKQCDCTCNNQWTGLCDTCTMQFGGADCDTCNTGYINYPTCTACTLDGHCSGHASGVSSNAAFDKCQCTCTAPWTGEMCQTCPDPYTGVDCDACKPGYKDYPKCDPVCTLTGSCNSHASDVKWMMGDVCACTCTDQWTGDTCKTCPAKYESTTCASCADGIGYPNCGVCSVASHCSSHATNVKPNALKTACECTCTNQWAGSNCGMCPIAYKGADCNECAYGRKDYPTCTPICSIETSCSYHASMVKYENNTCVCTCSASWTGDSCENCIKEYDQTTCDACAYGMQGFPVCTEICTAASCNMRATRVEYNGTGCNCTCSDMWAGDSCERCPMNYDLTGGCKACASGYIKYPACEMCSIATHCSGHATSVREEGNSRCICACANKWSGLDCSVCPEGFSGADCDRCAPGHIMQGEGCHKCSMLGDCSPNAISVGTDASQTTCQCTCRNRWMGADCTLCSSLYGGDDCNECNNGRPDFPACGSQCTLDVDCNGHADSVEKDPLEGYCVCSCNNQWIHSTKPLLSRREQSCTVCPPQFGGENCDRCAVNATGTYPDCVDCRAYCNYRASEATPNVDGTCTCACDEAKQWRGEKCDNCDWEMFSGDCNECARGLTGTPPVCHSIPETKSPPSPPVETKTPATPPVETKAPSKVVETKAPQSPGSVPEALEGTDWGETPEGKHGAAQNSDSSSFPWWIFVLGGVACFVAIAAAVAFRKKKQPFIPASPETEVPLHDTASLNDEPVPDVIHV